MQQSGSVLWWAGLSLEGSIPCDQQWHRGLAFTNVFRGSFTSPNTITGEWANVTRGLALNSGTPSLAVDTSAAIPRLTTTAVTGDFFAEFWL
jgi:hypothetical protein